MFEARELHGRDYYEYYRDERRWDATVKGEWQANYARFVNEVFRITRPGLRALDVGGAAGSQASAMRDLHADVWMIEPERYFLEISPFKNMRGRMLHAPASAIPFQDAWFDFVHSSQVFEHFHDEAEARASLDEIHRVTRPEGLLFVTLQVDKGDPQPADDDVTHRFVVPMDDWDALLDETGWAVVTDQWQGQIMAQEMQRQYHWDYFCARRKP